MITPSLNIWHIVCLFGAFQGIFLFLLLLFNKRGNKSANIFLALFVLVFSLRLIEIVAFWSRHLINFPFLFALTHPLVYLFGPLLYFYARFLLNDNGSFSVKNYLFHLLPFTLHFFAYLPFYFLDPQIKIKMIERLYTAISNEPRIELVIIYLLQIPHLLIYTLLTNSLVKSYDSKLKNHFSTIQRVNLKWLQQLLVAFAVFTIAWMSYGMLSGFGATYYFAADYILTIGMAVVVYSIVIKSFFNPEIYSQLNTIRSNGKYEKSTLTESLATKIEADIQKLMGEEKPYLNSSIKLNEFANLLDAHPHHVSQILNEKFELTFYDFINKHRVDEFKRKLNEPDNKDYTLLALAFEAGFNNKTSFNNAVKKFTGKTPVQFKNQINHSR